MNTTARAVALALTGLGAMLALLTEAASAMLANEADVMVWSA